jgi:hypothetical protein
MASFLGLLLHALASPFKSQVRLAAKIVFLRHQLNLLRRRLPAKPRLTTALSRCGAKNARDLCSGLSLGDFDRRPPSVIAAARKPRCVDAEVRWRCTLKVL